MWSFSSTQMDLQKPASSHTWLHMRSALAVGANTKAAANVQGTIQIVHAPATWRTAKGSPFFGGAKCR
jgi:hypothetical protein